METQSKLPSTCQLNDQVQISQNQQYDFIDSLKIYSLELEDINCLQSSVDLINASNFKTRLLKIILCRRNQLDQQFFKQQQIGQERRKVQLDQDILKLEREKQEFFENIETHKIRIDYLRVIFALITLVLTACGLFAFVLQPPSFAVPVGGKIEKAQVEERYKVIGIIIMSVLAFGVGLVTIAFSFWGCLRGKLHFTRKKLQ